MFLGVQVFPFSPPAKLSSGADPVLSPRICHIYKRSASINRRRCSVPEEAIITGYSTREEARRRGGGRRGLEIDYRNASHDGGEARFDDLFSYLVTYHV